MSRQVVVRVESGAVVLDWGVPGRAKLTPDQARLLGQELIAAADGIVPSARDVLGELLTLADQLAKQSTIGMAFVPDLVTSAVSAHLGAAGQVRSMLLDLDRVGELELRPESGLGRLSADERAQCPAMADGTPLSWARVR